MPLPLIKLEGRSTDSTLVQCTIELDPDTISTHNTSFGNLLVVRARPIVELSHMVGVNSIFHQGRGHLIHLNGIIGTENGSWGKAVLSQSQPGEQGTHVSILVPLNEVDLEPIENARNGREMVFRLRLSGLVNICASSPYEFSHRNGAKAPHWHPVEVVPVSDGGVLGSGGDMLRIHRDRWIEVLQRIGKRCYVVELPMPALPETQEWDSVVRLLAEAEARHRGGQYEDAIKKCRELVEGIATILAERWSIPRGKGKSFDSWTREIEGRFSARLPDSQEQMKALGSLLSAVWAWSSPLHHYGQGVPIREEASFAIHLCTSLLSYTGQLLDKYPALVRHEPSGG